MTVTPFTIQDRADLKEVTARVRRTETRLTRWLEAQGLDTGIQRPFWKDDRIILPSPAVTIETIIQAVPRAWPAHKPVDVVLAETDEVICQIIVP